MMISGNPNLRRFRSTTSGRGAFSQRSRFTEHHIDQRPERHRCGLDPAIAFGELGLADQQFGRLRFAQWREDIHMGRKLLNRPSTLGKSRKGFEPRLASWAMPEMANNLIIQKFRRVRCNDFMVAPNTVDSEHVSFIHPVHRA